ncbi:MAG TPA: hypothetical protein VJB15_12640 [Rhodothermia bacterium]|nr:hypothetical protein [Rhodothermia bacterium]
MLWLDVMHRRFGIEEFAAALQRFDQVLTEQPKHLRLLRVLRRMADYDNPLEIEDLEAVSHPSDRIIVSALYCDRLGLPPSFPEVLAKAVKAGTYYLPHVLLAWFWIQENGHELALPDGFVDDMYSANAAIINNDPRVVSDLKLEAAAFLYLAGQGALVDDVFVESVIVTQNDDGGWGKSPDGQGGSDWHATILGLLLLLHVKFPADSVEIVNHT